MISDYILTSSIALVIGLFIFYILSLIVVHLGGFLQKEISISQWSKEKPFTGYVGFLLKDIVSSGLLHGYTFRYINPFKTISFPSIGIRKIDRMVVFLDTLRIFFLPFLICGIIFLFFSFEIKGYLPLDLPNTFYSTIQENLLLLHEHPFLRWVRRYKIWVNLFLGLLIILIPILFIYRARLKVGIKRFNQLLVYIAILTNMTFFSGVAADTHKDVELELSDICLKIEEVHERIYKKGSALAVYDYVDDVEEKYSEYETTLEELESYVIAERFSVGDEYLGRELDESLRKFLDSTRTATVSIQKLNQQKLSQESSTSYFRGLREYGASQYQPSEPLDYIFDQEKWTYKNGIDLEVKLDNHIADIQSATREKYKSSKGYLIVEEIYNALSSFGIGVVSDLLSEGTGEIAKVLLKSVNKATKDDIVNQITSSLKGFRSKAQKKLGIDKIKQKKH